MNTSLPPELPSSSVNLQSIRGLLQQAGHQTTGKLAGLTVRSHFQPIFSVAHSRTVGFEGLMRPTDPSGHPISPLDALAMGRDFSHILTLDRLANAVHVHNFQQLKADGWLFLNMNTAVFLESVHDGHFLGELLEATGFPAHRVVIEILEQGVLNEVRLGEAVQFFRKQGFLIALDDFGAGHSNFDRVWNLQPDIVKLDRSMTTQAGSNLRIRRMMPVMVSLLHEAGSLVLMEGIETEGEALMAMDADADFVQGYYFAMPAESLPSDDRSRALFDQLWIDFREVTLPEVSFHRREVSPYINAIGYAASLIESGIPLTHAASGFLDLPGAERCYLLDKEGRQIGDNMVNPRQMAVADQRYSPVANAQGANWSRRFYFRRALEHPGRVQVTRPYLSIAGANQCITVSIGSLVDGEMRVLCGDVSWRDRGPVKR
ncbi:MAG TPA: EAL domain-containing protein [Burkholderiales bacterium]|jgi:EAL domain-containing protein (putative c-di-GMP-specific phosphodiesterase class I)